MGIKRKNGTLLVLSEIFKVHTSSHQNGQESPQTPYHYLSRIGKQGQNFIAHVTAIFLLLVFEKPVIINDFRAIAHSISAWEGGNMVCWNAMVRNKTDDDSVTYWFPWKHPMARRRGLEYGVFDQTPPKTGSSARPYGPRRSIFFPPQNYHSQSIGSALRASPCASFFARKHNPNVGSALQASPFKR